MRLKVTVTKTSRGDQDYIQIMSDDMLSVNVVLVADKIEVSDHRPGLVVTTKGSGKGTTLRLDDDVTPDVARRRGPR